MESDSNKTSKSNNNMSRLSDASMASTASTRNSDASFCSSSTSTSSITSTSASASSITSASTSSCSTQNIRVVTRIRPLSTREKNEKSIESVTALQSTKMIQVAKNKDFAFDAVFGPNATQRDVYEQTAGDTIRNNLFKGFNVTVLAYGQTGSGKTHTIFGGNGNMVTNELNEELDGIIPRAVHDVFDYMNQITCGPERVKVKMSYLEIYNEEAKDLLSEDPSPPDLQIRDNGGDVIVQNLSLHDVTSPVEVATLMESAADKRSTAATLMNAVSSRSHAICTLYIRVAPLPGQTEPEDEITAKLTLVDLAGSERAKKTGAEGARLKEGININKGLFVLGQVVSSLAELGQQSGSSDASSCTIHVKYRDSKLTRLLQDSLGGNSKTVMVACISPADTNVDETVNTLRYAERTRSIQNSAVRNVVATPLSPAEAAALRRENQMLKLQLFQAQAKMSSMSSLPTMAVASNQIPYNLASMPASANYDPECATLGIVENELNGLSLRDLDIVTKLKTHCTSLGEKVHQLEEKCKATSDDCLDASLRADKWQTRCESLGKIINDNNIELPAGEGTESSNILRDLRQEIVELKDRLQDTAIDAEVSRSVAAAVLNRNGDFDSAETMAMVSNSATNEEEDDDADEATSKMATEVLSAELNAMSGSIEHKEGMIKQIQKERELMESMKSHFENAIQSLQDEVGSLSTERDTLVTRLERENAGKDGKDGDKDDVQTRRLRDRTKALESRIKDLRQKTAEHTKSLRLHTQAEKKCQKLEAELSADKKRRTELQRKLKKESVERRTEQKRARLDAAKMLRDSQRLKLELNKVKDAAAKQENVLRRKATESMHRQKLLAERTKKRARAAGSITSDLSSQRKEEINSFVERELTNALSLQKLRDDIDENNEMLEETEERREMVKSQQSGNEDIPVLRSLDAEIDLRSKIIEQLEKNVKEIFKSVNRNPHAAEKQSSKFIEISLWQSLSKSEVRYVSQVIFAKLIEQQYECDSLKGSKKSDAANQVTRAIEVERRSNEKELMQLKVQHSEDISGLLESTKSTVQRDVTKKIAISLSKDRQSLDNESKSSIDNMLDDYFSSYSAIGEKVKSEIEGIKANQDGIKRLVDGMADNMISQNEAKAMLVAAKKKKAKKSKAVVDVDIFESEEEADGVAEDGDDSDWSPETPMHSKKRLCPSPAAQEPIKSPPRNTTAPAEAEQPQLAQHYEKMTVVELRALLRKNGLTVSGKKAELIERLAFYGSAHAKEVVVASVRKRVRSAPRVEIPGTASKRLRMLSPVFPKQSPLAPSRTTRKSPRCLTSSTKASMLRRRTPTETETTHLITKRSGRRSPSKSIKSLLSASTTSVSNDSQASVRSSRKQAKKPSVPKQVTSSKGKIRTSSDSNFSSDSARPLSTKRPALESSSSTSSSLSSKRQTKENSSSSSTSNSSSTSRTRISRRAAISSVSTNEKKKGSPLGARKQRPKTLSNLTNSAKKRKTTRRQDIAKDVTARLAALEELQNVL